MNMLRFLFPRSWSARYWDEMADLCRQSPRPVAAVVDMVLLAARLRAQQLARHAGWAVSVSSALVFAAAVGIAACVPRLAHGWVELPGHWWSAPWLLAGALGCAGFSAVLYGKRPSAG
ncbi:hypothetical protein V3C33_07655 [Micrococcaceae bacterium Sec5.7]